MLQHQQWQSVCAASILRGLIKCDIIIIIIIKASLQRSRIFPPTLCASSYVQSNSFGHALNNDH